MKDEIEREARWLTWKAWLRRDHGRLFDPGPPLLTCKAEWDRADDMYWGKAVGVMPNVDVDGSSDIAVGEWRGFGAGLGGMTLQLRTIGMFGVTTHRSPLNVGWIYVLPQIFQNLVAADWARREDAEWDGKEICQNCDYIFKEGEQPCRCEHEGAYLLCGGCCYTQTVREERAYDKMLNQMTGVT